MLPAIAAMDFLMKHADLVIKLEERYARLTPSERQVADLFRSNPEFFKDSSLFDIAVRAGVSEPSIGRFCKSLDLKGLRDLRDAISSDE